MPTDTGPKLPHPHENNPVHPIEGKNFGLAKYFNRLRAPTTLPARLIGLWAILLYALQPTSGHAADFLHRHRAELMVLDGNNPQALRQPHQLTNPVDFTRGGFQRIDIPCLIGRVYQVEQQFH